jgi:predicted acylesterase/phospholipase RssA
MTMKTARILSIDGGGIRGLIPAAILKSWEHTLGKPISECFHMLSGTSTGGILATGLATKMPAAKLVDFYQSQGPSIFSNTLGAIEVVLGNIYDSAPLEKALQDVFGTKNLSEVPIDLLVTAYEMEARQPRLFKSWRARGLETLKPRDDDFSLVSLTRATSAAPTYFPPAHIKNASGHTFTMVDGGVFANNPAMCAYVAARRLYPHAENFLIVSLGTGALTRSYTFDEVSGWGIAGWAQPLLDVMFSGVADTITYQLDQLAPEVRQFRFQSSLENASESMDDVSTDNLKALIQAGEDTVKTQSKVMLALLDILKSPLESLESLGYPLPPSAPVPKTFSKPSKPHTHPPELEPAHEPVPAVAHTQTPTQTPVPAQPSAPATAAVGMMGGAALGGAIAGPVGALVGAVAGGVVGALADRDKKV